MNGQNAVLAVSFGTSSLDSGLKGIAATEEAIREAFPQSRFYRAWCSSFLIRKAGENGFRADTVSEAMERMKADGIRFLTVQPVFVLNGAEYGKVCQDIRETSASFAEVRIGEPLLSGQADEEKLISILKEEWKDIPSDIAFVLMGHGTSQAENAVYESLDRDLKKSGFTNAFVGIRGSREEADRLITEILKAGYRKAVTAPLMIVAGKHAACDMSGPGPDSWKSKFQTAGIETECVMKGLGEYRGIREIFTEHAVHARVIGRIDLNTQSGNTI